MHGILAVLFFVGTAVYGYRLSTLLWRHRAQFEPDKQCIITTLWYLAWIMWGTLLMLGLAWLFDWFPQFWEWVVGILYLNYFAFAAFMNPYYNTIHQPNA